MSNYRDESKKSDEEISTPVNNIGGANQQASKEGKDKKYDSKPMSPTSVLLSEAW